MGLLSGLGKLAGGLFGASKAGDIPRFEFEPNIKTPAFQLFAREGGLTTLTRTGSPQRFPNVLGKLSALGEEVRPGFGRFTEAAVKSIRRAKGDALGNAREQLSRRRVLGSGFANAQLASIEEKFGETEARFRTDALLKELDQTFKIINQEFAVKTRNFQIDIAELEVATNLTKSMAGVLSDQARLDKAIAVRAAEGQAEFFANIGQDIFGGLELPDFSGGGGVGAGSSPFATDATGT